MVLAVVCMVRTVRLEIFRQLLAILAFRAYLPQTRALITEDPRLSLAGRYHLGLASVLDCAVTGQAPEIAEEVEQDEEQSGSRRAGSPETGVDSTKRTTTNQELYTGTRLLYCNGHVRINRNMAMPITCATAEAFARSAKSSAVEFGAIVSAGRCLHLDCQLPVHSSRHDKPAEAGRGEMKKELRIIRHRDTEANVNSHRDPKSPFSQSPQQARILPMSRQSHLARVRSRHAQKEKSSPAPIRTINQLKKDLKAYLNSRPSLEQRGAEEALKLADDPRDNALSTIQTMHTREAQLRVQEIREDREALEWDRQHDRTNRKRDTRAGMIISAPSIRTYELEASTDEGPTKLRSFDGSMPEPLIAPKLVARMKRKSTRGLSPTIYIPAL
ncbi:hypothetical protein C8R44DRAFT_748030 [Mycena epipterygia]|nr:hypothetical protein C8R44DRAFT_748030 [Mycena epipterygia]